MAENIFDVAGKRVLITGGSRGIGKALALFLREAGAKVAVLRHHTELPEELVKAGIAGIQCDIRDDGARKQAFGEAMEHLGGLDVLVNCAGIDWKIKALDMPLDDFRNVLDVNLTALFDMSRLAARQMKGQGGGKIVQIASMRAFRASDAGAAYGASKSAVMHLTKCLAREWAEYGVQVNGIAPGYFVTDMTKKLFESERGAQILAQIPMHRTGQMEDLRGALLFLCSAASAYVTGVTIPVDGGFLC